MKRKSLLILSCITSLLSFGQTAMTGQETERMSTSKTYQEVGIHDPSIVYNPTDEAYYVVGSHRGWAKSSDLLNFSALNSNNIYSTPFDSQFKSSPEHQVKVVRDGVTTTEILKSCNAGAFCATYAGIKVGDRNATTEANWLSGDQWAPDIIYNPQMEKWCMYLSLNGDYWASVIVLLTADSPAGPFTYQAPIVFSGFNGQNYSGKSVNYKDTDLELVLGELSELPSRYKTNTWGNLWPNCIDPCVFFDDDNNLWLAYGSWSGGIFMLKLDKETGLRDYTQTYEAKTYSGKDPNGAAYTGYLSDPYFGKLIAGGAYVSGEGPYIQKIGDYYYLFMSYGGLNPNAGYEMRIFRSATPDGDYVDASGNNARYTNYQLNFGRNASTNKGMKILGAMNGWGTMKTGECAEGHNSATLDPDGNAFVVYHTKFNDGSFGFQVRTRQLFTNEQGWLVASPFRYTGLQTTQEDINSRRLFSPEEIAGTYQLLIHPYRLNHDTMEEATPVVVTLSEDGKISGEKTGTWTYSKDGTSFVDLNISAITYHGVALSQKVDGYVDMPAICFSAVSDGGVPVWLYRLAPEASIASAYRQVVKDYLGNESTVIKGDAPEVDNVNIVYEAFNHASGDPEPETLSADGKFTPTEDSHAIDVNVEFTSGDYILNVGPYTRATMSDQYVEQTPDLYPISRQKNTDAGWWANFSDEDYVLEKEKSMRFHFYNYSAALENWHNWALYGASATHGAAGYTEYFGIRCDNWDNTTASNAGCTSNFNWDTFKNDMNGSKVDMTVEYTAEGVFKMESEILTTAGKTYKYSYTKAVPGTPSSLTLFFVSERSYIDGEPLSAVEEIPVDGITPADGKTYNLFGIEVDETYKGFVIRNGRKMIQH